MNCWRDRLQPEAERLAPALCVLLLNLSEMSFISQKVKETMLVTNWLLLIFCEMLYFKPESFMFLFFSTCRSVSLKCNDASIPALTHHLEQSPPRISGSLPSSQYTWNNKSRYNGINVIVSDIMKRAALSLVSAVNRRTADVSADRDVH